eukprot:m.157911 g.157911  ORF g.157911 m.157911 type:complete len:117 (-) comp14489_c0_seq3:118-468(-)
MGPCNSRAMWTHGWVRGQPTLQNQYLHEMSAPNFTAWCLHIGVWPQNMTCRYDGTQHTPGIRQCTEGTPAGGGNPVGSGFNFTGYFPTCTLHAPHHVRLPTPGTIRHSCGTGVAGL